MLSEDYIIGLTDGEGSFSAYIRPPKKEHGSKSYRVECHYYLKLREDELPLLKKVKKFFGCGRISFQKDKRENHRDCYRFEVSNLKDINNVIVPFFGRKLLYSSNRRRDFKIFCKIVSLVNEKAHQRENGLKKILKLKSQMHK